VTAITFWSFSEWCGWVGVGGRKKLLAPSWLRQTPTRILDACVTFSERSSNGKIFPPNGKMFPMAAQSHRSDVQSLLSGSRLPIEAV